MVISNSRRNEFSRLLDFSTLRPRDAVRATLKNLILFINSDKMLIWRNDIYEQWISIIYFVKRETSQNIFNTGSGQINVDPNPRIRYGQTNRSRLFSVCIKYIQLAVECRWHRLQSRAAFSALRNQSWQESRSRLIAGAECYQEPGPVFPAISKRLGASDTIGRRSFVSKVSVSSSSLSSSSSGISNRTFALPI